MSPQQSAVSSQQSTLSTQRSGVFPLPLGEGEGEGVHSTLRTPHSTLDSVILSILECSRAQAAAAREEDWEAFHLLTSKRAELMDQSARTLGAAVEPPNPKPQTPNPQNLALIGALLAEDAATREILEAKHAEVCEEMGRFRQFVTMAAAYHAPTALPARGSIVDSVR